MVLPVLTRYQKRVLFLLNFGAAIIHTCTSITAIALNQSYPQIQFKVTGNTYVNGLSTGHWIVNTFISSSFGVVGLAATYGLIDALYHFFMAYQCSPWTKGDYNIYNRVMIRAVNPIRWIAYSISAPLQFFVYCVVTGFTNDFQLVLMVIMMWLIMYFGWIQEEWNNLIYIQEGFVRGIVFIGAPGDRKMRILDNSGLILDRSKLSFLERLQLFALKVAPLTVSSFAYIIIWVLLFINYFNRVDIHLPYSEALIIGGFISFFSFGLVMTLQTFEVGNLKRVVGQLWYFNDEVTYQILSFTAKFFQSLTLIISLSVWVAENPL